MIAQNISGTERFDLPAWLQISLAIIGVISFIFGAIEFSFTIRATPRRRNEGPVQGKSLGVVRRWRPLHYSLALGHLTEFCQRLKGRAFYDSSDERGRVTEYDLVRWIIHLGLTCAAQMVPQSLGKANLFRVSSINRDTEGRPISVRVYSSEFVGVFSPNQLTDVIDGTYMRDLEFQTQGQGVDEFPAALQCVGKGLPVIQSLRDRRSTFDQPERDLGATHILAIPLISDFRALKKLDQPVSITVDLRFGRLRGWFIDYWDREKLSFYRRAVTLSRILREVQQLSDPQFLPPTNSRGRHPHDHDRNSGHFG